MSIYSTVCSFCLQSERPNFIMLRELTNLTNQEDKTKSDWNIQIKISPGQAHALNPNTWDKQAGLCEFKEAWSTKWVSEQPGLLHRQILTWKKMWSGMQDGSGLKGIWLLFLRICFNSQHPKCSSQLSVTPFPRARTPLGKHHSTCFSKYDFFWKPK